MFECSKEMFEKDNHIMKQKSVLLFQRGKAAGSEDDSVVPSPLDEAGLHLKNQNYGFKLIPHEFHLWISVQLADDE